VLGKGLVFSTVYTALFPNIFLVLGLPLNLRHTLETKFFTFCVRVLDKFSTLGIK
jgi:hypothetical protein